MNLNQVQQSVKIKYLNKKLHNTEQEIERWDSKLNSCEVNLRQQKQLRDSLIDMIMDLEVEMNGEVN